jgi:hypothetical protein
MLMPGEGANLPCQRGWLQARRLGDGRAFPFRVGKTRREHGVRQSAFFFRSAVSAIFGALIEYLGVLHVDARSRARAGRPSRSKPRSIPMPAPTTRSAEADDKFFTALENGHAVRAACLAAAYARRCVYRWRKSDAAFAARWATALTMAGDLLEEEADRRGRDGTDVPVFHRGEVCGSKRKYSDPLLLARLKAIRPEQYREKITIAGNHSQPVSVVLRDFALEDLARRLARGERVDMTTVPARIRRVLEAAEDENRTPGQADRGHPIPVPCVPLPAR